MGKGHPREVLTPVVVVRNRPWDMEFSIVAQVDGILHSIVGVRIDRDVLAPSAAGSVCLFFGRALVEPMAAFCGIYFGESGAVDDAVAQCVAQHAMGAFVVPVVSDCPVMVGKRRDTPWMFSLLTGS